MAAGGDLDDGWLSAFHSGDRATLERCYRDHHARVAACVGRMLPESDAESVTHEVFYRLLSDATLRANFHGGNLGAWLTRVATHSALDHLRRLRRERAGGAAATDEAFADAARADDELQARLLVEQFRRERLPPQWEGVFEARFLRRLPQREAARVLGIHRTTLVYREHRILAMLRKFLLRKEAS